MTMSLVRWSRDNPRLWRFMCWVCPLLKNLNYRNDQGWIRCKTCDRMLEYFDFLWPKDQHEFMSTYLGASIKGEAECMNCCRIRHDMEDAAARTEGVSPDAEPEEEKPPALNFPDPGNMWFGDEDGPLGGTHE